MQLETKQLEKEEIYRNIVRVFDNERVDERSKKVIEEGEIARITVRETGKSIYVILRGNKNGEKTIKIEEYLRNRLGVDLNTKYEFYFKKAGIFGSYLFAWNATEVGYRISARIALISLLLGIISLFISIFF